MKKFTCDICGQENDKLRCRNTDAHDRINKLTDIFGGIIHSAVHSTDDFIEQTSGNAKKTDNLYAKVACYENMCLGYYIKFLRTNEDGWTSSIDYEEYMRMLLSSKRDLFDNLSYDYLVEKYGI